MKNWHGAHGPAHALKREEQEAIIHLTGPYPSFRMLRTAKPRAGLGYAGSLAQMVTFWFFHLAQIWYTYVVQGRENTPGPGSSSSQE